MIDTLIDTQNYSRQYVEHYSRHLHTISTTLFETNQNVLHSQKHYKRA